jgi:tRNA(Leu) C34 or U34 (ribose-2'-O)-methylase TrmL
MNKCEKMKNKGYAAIGLKNPKTPSNIGSSLRACHCYGASMIAIEGTRFKKSATDTYNEQLNTPVIETYDLHSIIPFDCVPVAIELIDGAQSLIDYVHPDRAFYIFGAEDATLGKKTLSWCRDVVYVPTNGCMNLAATVNVVLYDRLSKQLNKSK